MSLTIIPVGPAAYAAQVVEYLEKLLQQAKDGRIGEMHVLYRLDGTYNHCYTGTNNLHEVIGCIELIKYRTIKRTDRNDT